MPVNKAYLAPLQDDDLNEALEWLVWADKYGPPQLADRAEVFVVEHGGNIPECPVAIELSSECLLRLLEARHIQKQDVQVLIQGAVAPSDLSYTDTDALYRWDRGLPPWQATVTR